MNFKNVGNQWVLTMRVIKYGKCKIINNTKDKYERFKKKIRDPKRRS